MSKSLRSDASADDDIDLDEYALSMMTDAELRKKMACYCAWTTRFAAHARRKGWYTDAQLHVTGHPRMDFYAPQWTDAAKRMSPYAENYGENLVLINGSFALANPRYQSAEKELEMLITRFSYGRDYAERWLDAQRRAMNALTTVANSLARRFPDVAFVYRPHPFEGEEAYKSLLDQRPNLHLVQEGTTDGWLLRAKALVHWGSSTAIDACLAHIPAFTPGWIPAYPPIPFVEAVSIPCRDEAAMGDVLQQVLNGTYTLPENITAKSGDVVENTFYKIDGCAHERVAEAIWNTVIERRSRPDVRVCRELSRRAMDMSLRGRAVRAVKGALGLPSDWSFRRMRRAPRSLDWDSSGKKFDVERVQCIADAIRECAGRHSDGSFSAICVESARERGDYSFGFYEGRAVSLRPTSAPCPGSMP